uniref:Unannotated protein n=1 Tax=freshwater metagenome TaxID=449393 RepID=A0A6J7NA15_9ZZZZ
MLGQMDVRVVDSALVAGPERSSVTSLPSAPMSSTGTTTSISSGLRIPASTMATGRAEPGAENPPRKAAVSSSGRCVAERPMRCGGRAVISSSRSRLSARCAPRLVGASAWISSRITHSTLASVSRADDVSSRYRLSGVVINRSGGLRSMRWRSLAGVSPVRRPTVGSMNGTPRRSAASLIPCRGALRFFSISNASARSGEMYSTRVRALVSGAGVVTSRSIAPRNAVSVLPEPVGAQMSVCSPAMIRGQPCTWAAVGSGNDVANQVPTAGENAPSTGCPGGVGSGRSMSAGYDSGVAEIPGGSPFPRPHSAPVACR